MGLRRVDPFQKKKNKAARLALNSIGRDLVYMIRWVLNVPVQKIPGFGVIRSEPGEPPRREFNVLRKAIKYRVLPKATSVQQLQVYTNYKVAVWLEYGNRRIEPRPFFFKTIRSAGSLVREFKKRFKQNMETMTESSNPDWNPFDDEDFSSPSSANGKKYKRRKSDPLF